MDDNVAKHCYYQCPWNISTVIKLQLYKRGY